MKAIVTFTRTYEITINDGEEVNSLRTLEYEQKAREEFASEFEFLDVSSDNFSAKVKLKQ